MWFCGESAMCLCLLWKTHCMKCTTSPFSVWMINMFTFFFWLVLFSVVSVFQARGEQWCAYVCVRNGTPSPQAHNSFCRCLRVSVFCEIDYNNPYCVTPLTFLHEWHIGLTVCVRACVWFVYIWFGAMCISSFLPCVASSCAHSALSLLFERKWK